jgi:hypothetical protein
MRKSWLLREGTSWGLQKIVQELGFSHTEPAEKGMVRPWKKRMPACGYVDGGGRVCSSTGKVRVWLFLTIVTFIVWPRRVYSSR